MEVHVTDDQIGRYFRRIQLGLRFLSHGARAQTTCKWSGLTPDQLVTLRRRWLFNTDDRLRGPSPSSFEIFFRSRNSRAQAALFLGIARIVGAMPSRSGAGDALAVPSLENGERLCEAFEAFCEWEPRASYDFEQAVLLLTGAARAEKIELAQCPNCSTAILRDKLAGVESTCLRCRRKQASH
jgi:hypothetical protein